MPAKSIFLFVVVGIMSFSIGAFTALQIMKSGYSGAKDITFPEVIDGGESIDIFDIPSDVFTKRDLRSARLTHNSFWETIYRDGARQRHVTYSNHEISSLEFSPITGDKLGFFYYPNDNAVTDISLAIMDIPQRSVKEVYRNSVRTSDWEWDGVTRVIVYYNCGTECLYAYKIDVDTGERVDEYHVY